MENEIKMVRVIVTGKINAYEDLNGTNDKAIFVSQEDLDQIGKTKCFDLENNCVVDYDNTKNEKKQAKLERIVELKTLLTATDYKAIKYAEGLINEIEYAETKVLRQSYREEINKLEEELKALEE